MSNTNYCVGCYYNGTADGYIPECSNCGKKFDTIIASIENNEDATNYMSEHVDELLPDTKQTDTTNQDDKKARRMERRIAARKYARKAPKNLAITIAKLNRLPGNASSADFKAANKKLFNADKKSRYRYQTSIALAFPEIPKGTSFGNNIEVLQLTIGMLENAKNASPELKVTCTNAINILKAASDYDGQVVGLHRTGREGNVLQVKIGFHDKTSKSEFLRRTVA